MDKIEKELNHISNFTYCDRDAHFYDLKLRKRGGRKGVHFDNVYFDVCEVYDVIAVKNRFCMDMVVMMDDGGLPFFRLVKRR